MDGVSPLNFTIIYVQLCSLLFAHGNYKLSGRIASYSEDIIDLIHFGFLNITIVRRVFRKYLLHEGTSFTLFLS
jgi:hypothetical protein